MSKYAIHRRAFLSRLSGLAALLTTPRLVAERGRSNRGDSSQAGADGSGTPRIGLALGAGGANGLAHVPVLEVLDEMGLRPARIAGASIGAVVGALYASGMSGRDIRALVNDFFADDGDNLAEKLVSGDALKWVEFVEVELGNGGLLSSDGLIRHLYGHLERKTFDALAIPLRIVAGDLWNRAQVVVETGGLLPAVQASMALPGVFQPVVREGQVLVDGGTVNPVPWDLLTDDCDLVIAVDVIGVRSRPTETDAPAYFETIFNSAKVMQQAIVNAKRRLVEPDIYLATGITDVRALEFYRADEVFEQAQPAAQELRRRLAEVL